MSTVNEAWYLLDPKLHTFPDKTQLITILHSRLEAVTQGVKMHDANITFDIF